MKGRTEIVFVLETLLSEPRQRKKGTPEIVFKTTLNGNKGEGKSSARSDGEKSRKTVLPVHSASCKVTEAGGGERRKAP